MLPDGVYEPPPSATFVPPLLAVYQPRKVYPSLVGVGVVTADIPDQWAYKVTLALVGVYGLVTFEPPLAAVYQPRNVALDNVFPILSKSSSGTLESSFEQ